MLEKLANWTRTKGLILGALLSIGGGHAGATAYSLQVLDTFGGNSSAYAINNAGQIVGQSDKLYTIDFGSGPNPVSTVHGVMWHPQGMTDLGQYMIARDINENGQIAGGEMLSQAWYGKSMVRTNGEWETLANNAQGRALNDLGQVVGERYTLRSSAYSGTTAVAWNGGGDLPSLGGPLNWVYGVNNAGAAVGSSQLGVDCSVWCTQDDVWNAPTHAVIWEGGAVIDLGTLSNGKYSEAFGINESGQVVGHARDSGNQFHAVTWVDGQILDLGLGQALAVNESGLIVGNNGAGRAMLWDGSTGIDLTTLLPTDSGWVLRDAADINDHGIIVGTAIQSSTGATRAFMLSPIPEPASALLMTFGFAGLVMLARRRHPA